MNRAGRTPPTVAEEQTSLTALAARRIALGDKVAAAKFGSSAPIDDAARERQLLADVVTRSREMGLDPDVSARFFRAQIEANKAVQRRLHDLWSTHPDLRPKSRPDLESEVRPQLDAITKEMLIQLKALQAARDAVVRAAGPLTEPFDDLHANALRIALAPIRELIEGDATPADDRSGGEGTAAA